MIEGRPSLTARLRVRLDPEPIVVSSVAYPEKHIERFQPTSLIISRDQGDDHLDSTERFRELLSEARTKFKIPPSESVRIACAGSQGSLWHREHNAAFPPSDLDDAAHMLLLDQRSRRQFALALRHAIEDLGGVELMWLAEAFPELRPRSRTLRYRRLVRHARRKMVELSLREGGTCSFIPFLFTRAPRRRLYGFGCSQTWNLFWEPRDPAGHGGPFRTTTALMRQYRLSAARSPEHECVLVKVMGLDPEGYNPLETPLMTREQLRYAPKCGINTVLLDARYGIIDPCGEADDSARACVYAA